MITTTLQSCEIITQKKQLIREASFCAQNTSFQNCPKPVCYKLNVRRTHSTPRKALSMLKK